VRRIVAVVILLALVGMRTGDFGIQAAAPLRCEIQNAPTLETKVAAGKAYFSAHGTLFAADLTSCAVLWTWTLDYEVIWFAASERAIFAVDDVRGEERGSRITSLSTDHGNVMWSTPVDFSAATAYLHDGVLLVQGESSLAGIDSNTGKQLWKVPFADPAFGEEFAFGVVFVFTIQNAYSGNEIKTVHVLDVHTGSERWQYTFEPALLSFTIPTDEQIVLFDVQHFADGGFEYVSYAFELSTGQLIWKVKDREIEFLGTSDGLGFGMHMAPDGSTTLHSFDLHSGEALWIVPTGFLPHALAITDNLVILLSYDDPNSVTKDTRTISAVDKVTGSTSWSAIVEGTLGGVAVSSGFGYFVKRGSIVAIDFSTGKTEWSFQDDSLPLMPGQVTASDAGIVISNYNTSSIYVFEPSLN